MPGYVYLVEPGTGDDPGVDRFDDDRRGDARADVRQPLLTDCSA